MLPCFGTYYGSSWPSSTCCHPQWSQTSSVAMSGGRGSHEPLVPTWRTDYEKRMKIWCEDWMQLGLPSELPDQIKHDTESLVVEVLDQWFDDDPVLQPGQLMSRWLDAFMQIMEDLDCKWAGPFYNGVRSVCMIISNNGSPRTISSMWRRSSWTLQSSRRCGGKCCRDGDQ